MFLIVWVNKASSRENNWIDGEEILGRWQGDVNFTTIIFRISNSLLAKYSLYHWQLSYSDLPITNGHPFIKSQEPKS